MINKFDQQVTEFETFSHTRVRQVQGDIQHPTRLRAVTLVVEEKIVNVTESIKTTMRSDPSMPWEKMAVFHHDLYFDSNSPTPLSLPKSAIVAALAQYDLQQTGSLWES